jgi:regulator of protease activity HflC (stomatin/prohibitin superfamily)
MNRISSTHYLRWWLPPLDRPIWNRRYFSTSFYGLAREKTPSNTIINFVPQQEAWIVERFGRYVKTLEPGLAFLWPFIDCIKYTRTLKEVALEIPSQSAITKDNVTLHIDGVLYVKVVDPYKAAYGVEYPQFAVTQLAQTTMRSEIGKITLDKTFEERTLLNQNIVEAINMAAHDWGIRCLRYEIRDIRLPPEVVEAMQMQVAAERRKRAKILESEGARESQINVAEGQKASRVLASEAERQEQINRATGEAQGIRIKAEATAESIYRVAEAIGTAGGIDAVGLRVAEKYVEAFSQIAKESTTLLLPSHTADAASAVTQALAIFKNVTKKPDTKE